MDRCRGVKQRGKKHEQRNISSNNIDMLEEHILS